MNLNLNALMARPQKLSQDQNGMERLPNGANDTHEDVPARKKRRLTSKLSNTSILSNPSNPYQSKLNELNGDNGNNSNYSNNNSNSSNNNLHNNNLNGMGSYGNGMSNNRTFVGSDGSGNASNSNESENENGRSKLVKKRKTRSHRAKSKSNSKTKSLSLQAGAGGSRHHHNSNNSNNSNNMSSELESIREGGERLRSERKRKNYAIDNSFLQNRDRTNNWSNASHPGSGASMMHKSAAQAGRESEIKRQKEEMKKKFKKWFPKDGPHPILTTRFITTGFDPTWNDDIFNMNGARNMGAAKKSHESPGSQSVMSISSQATQYA